VSYPQQPVVAARLQAETNSALDARIGKFKRELSRSWATTRHSIQAHIVSAYRTSAPSGKWSLASFRGSGAEARLRAETKASLLRFRSATTVTVRSALKTLRWESAMRHAWVLDQVTPPSRRVRVPVRTGIREAGILQTVSQVSWADRWTHWVDSYADALHNNLTMNAINESDLGDAVAEVDATTANTPRATLDSALSRMFNYEAQASIMAGEDDIIGLNRDLVTVEIWKTRGSKNVCDDCDANEGLEADQVDGDIPLHPNCNCFWEMVPKSYADLLASGDEDDNDLASLLQARGIVPIALVVRDEGDKIAAKVVIDFTEWAKGQYGVLGAL
jgi:hypothetical protein